MIDNKLEIAYRFVSNFEYFDVETNRFNKFDFDYKVPAINGISKYQWGKDFESVKPSVLEYIIYNLQNIEIKLLIDSVIAYLYYWRIRKADRKMMKKVYDVILKHYTLEHNDYIPKATITSNAMVYSISFNIGSIRVHKFGFTTDTNRYIKLIDDVKSKYEFPSIGSFTVHQEIQFDTVEQAKAFEEEALKNLKQHSDYMKCKYCFDGYKESYM